jgi:uroporphyrinogen-III synthase
MTVLLIRANRNEVDQSALQRRGITSVIDPYLSITPVKNSAGVKRMHNALKTAGKKWLVATSTNSLHFFAEALQPGELEYLIRTDPELRFAAIGEQTEQQLRELGAKEVLRASSADSSSLAMELGKLQPCPVIIPSSNIAMKSLGNELQQHGFRLIEEVVYSTAEVSSTPKSVAGVSSGVFSGVLLRSPSAARAFFNFNGLTEIPMFCAGRTTSAQAGVLGLKIALVSTNPSPASVAQSISDYYKEVNS